MGAATYDLTLRGGAATFSSALTLGDDRTLSLQSAGVMSQGATDVIIGGPVGLLALTSTADVGIRTSLSRVSANVTGALNITNTGDLASGGAVVVPGLTTLALGSSSVTLDNVANDFQGGVTLSNGANVTLSDINAIGIGVVSISGALAVTTPGAATLSNNVTANALDLSPVTGGIAIGAPLTVDVSAAAGDAGFTGSALSGGGKTLAVAADGMGTSNVLFGAISGISTLSFDTGSDDLVVLGRGADTVSVTTLDVSQTAGVLELEGDLAGSPAPSILVCPLAWLWTGVWVWLASTLAAPTFRAGELRSLMPAPIPVRPSMLAAPW
ncbi:MAG: hypothetical protein ACI8PT_001354 [Gammaproteobacteria bacterium]